ncbi:MAG: hypothetical protein ACE5FT_02065 [Candidatus Nanoarchaeia archaeon]
MASAYETYGKWLLLVGGLVHGLPQLYDWLTGLTAGTHWVQIVVGWVSVVVALMALKG